MNSGNNTKDFLDDIKSVFFCKKIFTFITQKKTLEIIKCNKILQKKLDININDYKRYSELYSSIELELIPCENRCDKFINILKKGKEYYHIYFDNSNEEMKRNYLKINEKVKKIKIIINYQINSYEKLFANCKYITEINFTKFFRTNITSMSSMFSGCSLLKNLNLSNFNTKSVGNMSKMFYKCSSLEEINLSNFDTTNVFNMSSMFEGCSSLKKLDLSNFRRMFIIRRIKYC